MDQEYPKTQFFWKTEKIIQNAKTQKRLESCQNLRYALWPEISNPSGSVVSGCTKNTQKPKLFEKRKKSSKTQKLKTSRNMPKLAIRPLTHRSLIHREASFPPCFVRQNQPKNYFFCLAILDHFQTKIFRSETTSIHYFFPWIPNLLNIGHPTLGSGGKKMFKRYLKSEHTHRQTDRQTDISTHRKHRHRGPMLWRRKNVCVLILPTPTLTLLCLNFFFNTKKNQSISKIYWASMTVIKELKKYIFSWNV